MDYALVAVRFVHLAAVMVLFGAAVFVAALAPASVSAELRPRLRRWAAALTGLALASGAAWFYLVARGMAGGDVDFDLLQDVAFSTAFGRVWLAHLAILSVLFAAAWGGERGFAALAGLALASLALTGHAAMQEGALGLAHRANHALHLLTTSGWLGGLPPFLLCLGAFAANPQRRDALAAMMTYSRAGHVAVAAVFLTGALDAAMTTGLPPWPSLSAYRTGVALKLTIFLAMVALALVNRYALAPRVGRSLSAARALAAGALGEIALALAAVADASAFATLSPL